MFHFFFNDTATTEIYTLSLHDALPISTGRERQSPGAPAWLLERARQERELAARSSVAHDFGFSDGRAASGISFEDHVVDDAGKAYKKVHYEIGRASCRERV